MSWQDIVFSVGSVIFSIALVPTLRGPTKPALSSSLMTAAILYIYSIVYVSLNLWYAMATGLITASCWTALAIQKWHSRPQIDPPLYSSDIQAETEAYAAYLNAVRAFPDEELAEDALKARRAVEIAWLEHIANIGERA